MKKLFLSSVVFITIFCLTILPVKVFADDNASTVNSTISVSSNSVPADGSTVATITINVKDVNNNIITGTHVTLTLTSAADSGLTINSETIGSTNSTAASDSNGNAVFTVKSDNSSPETDTFTATDTSDSPPVPLGTGSVSVTFTAAPLAPNNTCTDSAPGSAPQLTSAVSNAPNQITLTWTDASNPVSNYLVSYGLTSGQYIYGNPNIGPQGTTTYTVGSLTDGTTYYFMVKAVNGCNSGTSSNEVSAVAGGVSPTPIPTQIDTSTDIPQQDTDNSTAEDTPTDTPTIQPTDTPTPTPLPTAPSDNTGRTIIYGLSVVGALSLFGIIYLWKFKK